ncbi:MAG: peptidase T, partial [Candidatus Aenigmarchaeota archaeon]|nr:peptidase T [Candidatus Aenigmarchaeota archaeon]
MKEEMVQRFISYAKIDTQSDEDSKTSPSTEKQFVLAKKLVDELKDFGLPDAEVDEHCYVMATLKGNLYDNSQVPVVGFISHVDTAIEVSGKDVKPQIHKNYSGGDITVGNGIVIKEEENPELKDYIGEDIITASGDTLLGADDKAGISEIMTAVKYLTDHPEIKRGTIRIGFTPDEEIGKGTKYFDIEKFGAKYAYTIDGGEPGEVEDETFNAADATIKIKGVNVHPGYAKDKMVNSQKIAAELTLMLPDEESPENTDGDEGYYHQMTCKGDVKETILKLLIRDFDNEGLEARKEKLREYQKQLNEKYGDRVEIEITERYPNMKKVIDKYPEVVDIADKA